MIILLTECVTILQENDSDELSAVFINVSRGLHELKILKILSRTQASKHDQLSRRPWRKKEKKCLMSNRRSLSNELNDLRKTYVPLDLSYGHRGQKCQGFIELWDRKFPLQKFDSLVMCSSDEEQDVRLVNVTHATDPRNEDNAIHTADCKKEVIVGIGVRQTLHGRKCKSHEVGTRVVRDNDECHCVG